MQEFINVHCHLINFKFVPDSYFSTRAPVRKWLLRNRVTGWIARLVTFLDPRKKYDKLHEAIDLMKKDISNVADQLILEMKASKDVEIILSVPLMMDLETTSLNEKPDIPYRQQVVQISETSKRYPGKLLPFIMVDPRRKGVVDLIKIALEEKGFLGVKMYPSFGYDPNPNSFYNDSEVNNVLKQVYEYCERNQIPITTHCSPGGSYNKDAISCKSIYQDYCNPFNWRKALEVFPRLFLNLAHFGGNGAFLEKEKSEEDQHSVFWNDEIQKLMKTYDHVYADTAYHDSAVDSRASRTYFDKLLKLMEDDRIKHHIMFGTDWLMTRHTWVEKDFVNAFLTLSPGILNLIALENPLDFLFPGRKLPQRIKSFWDKNNISEAKHPSWVKRYLKVL